MVVRGHGLIGGQVGLCGLDGGGQRRYDTVQNNSTQDARRPSEPA